MEYVLLGALLLGVVLFVVGWLMVAAAGFQRHPVTGLLALLPVINVVALPSLWHRVSGWVITGLVGVLLAGVAWFAGANTHAAHYAQALGLSVESPPESAPAEVAAPPADSVTHTVELPVTRPPAPAAVPNPPPVTVPLSLPAAAQPVVLAKPAAQPAPAEPAPPPPPQPLPPTEDLPAKALYHLAFKEIAVDKLPGNKGRYVRVTQKDGRRREGKVLSTSADSIELEERMTTGSVTLPIKLGDIRSAAIMTSEGNP